MKITKKIIRQLIKESYMNEEFQTLQGQLEIYLNEDTVTNIALGISNSNLSDEGKVEVLKNIIKTFED